MKKRIHAVHGLHVGLCLFEDPGAADTYKIGAALPLTGPAQFLGEAERETMNMAVEQINAPAASMGRNWKSSTWTPKPM